MVTALLGLAVFGGKLPPMWWAGAGLLAGGNVVIGRREEGEKPGGTTGLDETREEAEELLLGDSVELEDNTGELSKRKSEEEDRKMLKRGEAADNPI